MYALSMAPLMTGFVRVLQFDGNVKLFLPQAIISFCLILSVVVVWWTIWWFREISWSFATYLLVIIEPLIMFISCSLIFPKRIEGNFLELESHYYKIRIPLLTSMLVWFSLVFMDDVLLGLEPIWNSRRYLHVVSVSLTLWALLDKRVVAQTVFALGFLVGTITMVGGWFWVPAN